MELYIHKTMFLSGSLVKTLTLVLIFVIISHCCAYRTNFEPLRQSQGCITSISKTKNITLTCFVRVLNSEFWANSSNLSANLHTNVSPSQISSLIIKCNEQLFFESTLRPNLSLIFAQFSQLSSISFDSCKIKKLPPLNLGNIKFLSVQTHNIEWNPLAELEIEFNSFANSKLTTLELSNSNIYSLPNNFLCPHLQNLNKLNLSRNSLSELPEELGKNLCGLGLRVKNLDISHNKIRKVSNSAFSGANEIVELRLENNYLEELEDSALFRLTNLKFLNISNNRLVALPPSLFSHCENLRELYLANNSLSALSQTLFSPLSKLVSLDLSQNSLSSAWMKNSVFSGVKNLISLKLNHNSLTFIDSQLFENLENLQALHLESNKIEAVQSDSFKNCKNLILLDLSRNRLSFFDSLKTDGFFQLRSLYLDHNELKGMAENSLTNFTNLQDLGLAGNKLTSVPLSIKNCKNLKTIDLGENKISSLENSSFWGLEQLYGLRLVDNKISELPSQFCVSLKKLRVLNLAQNKISRIFPNVFSGCPEIRALRLDNNNLIELPLDMTKNLPALLWLNVSENNLKWADFHLLPRTLEWLDLSYNNLKSLGGDSMIKLGKNPIPPGVNYHLRVLDASHNELTEITSSNFPKSLERLRLSFNSISKIPPDVFTHLNRLRRVELNANSLTTLNLNSIKFPILPAGVQLPEILLADNPLKCTCDLEWVTRLNQLFLSRNFPKIADIDTLTCEKVDNFENVGSNETKTVHKVQELRSGDFLCNYKTHCKPMCHCCEFDACDCEMSCPSNCTCAHDSSWNFNIVSCSENNFNFIPPRIPMEVTELKLDGNNFGELGSHIFIGKKNLRKLYLNSSGITGLKNKTFNGVKQLEILHLEHNLLTQLLGYEFNDIGNLRELYLEFNQISYIEANTFGGLEFLQVLKLDNNNLVDFGMWELSRNNYLNSLSLKNNPWTCDCDFVISFKNWAGTKSEILLDFSLATCKNEENDQEFSLAPYIALNCEYEKKEKIFSPVIKNEAHEEVLEESSPQLKNLDLNYNNFPGSENNLYISEKNEEKNENSALWAISISIVSVLVIILLVLLLIFYRAISCKSEKLVKVFPFCTKLKSSPECEISESVEKLFDAYFIYNWNDEDLLALKIIPELEKKCGSKLRVCLHRDLCLGLENAWNPQMVTSAAESSKKIILLLSPNFLNSSDFAHSPDFRFCIQNLLPRYAKKLVFILLQNNPAGLHNLFPALKNNSENVLHWTDPHFWAKFKKILPGSTCTLRSNTNSLYRGSTQFSHMRGAPKNFHSLNFGQPLVPNSALFFESHSLIVPPQNFNFSHNHSGTHGHLHSHEHQNSVSTISNNSNCYRALTEQNFSDSTNNEEEHLYSTLDSPALSPAAKNGPMNVNGDAQMYFV